MPPFALSPDRAASRPYHTCVWLQHALKVSMQGEARDEESALSPSIGHVRATLGEDLVCGTCGLPLAPLLVGADDDDKDTGDTESEADIRPAPQPQPTARKQPAKVANVKPRRAALKPGICHFKAVRRTVRAEMLAQIPGMNRAKARAVIDALPNGTLSAIMALPSGELAAISVGSGRLGTDLAQALKKVVS